MNKYETLFIIKPDLPEEDIEASIQRLKTRIERTEGKIAAIDYWGNRKLAYSIQYRGEKINRGFYVLLTYLGKGETVDEVERNIKIMDPTFRYLTTRVEGDFNPEDLDEISITRREQEPPPPEEEVQEAPEDDREREEPAEQAPATEEPAEQDPPAEEPAEQAPPAEEPAEQDPPAEEPAEQAPPAEESSGDESADEEDSGGSEEGGEDEAEDQDGESDEEKE